MTGINLSSQSNQLMIGRSYYKPFAYKEFYDRWMKHERSHWLPQEVPMHDDVADWKNKLTEKEKKFLTNIFRFFTQGDVDVAGAYCTDYIPNFCQTPEIAMFLCSVAAREAIHIDAYSYLIETLSMPESTYKEFLQYNEMKEKQDYIKKFQQSSMGSLGDKTNYYIMYAIMFLLSLLMMPAGLALILQPLFVFISIRLYHNKQRLIKEHIAAGIALFSGFTEGMQLFSSFVMLLSFPLNGLMKGMGQIITWSIVDETQHIDGMISLFRIFLKENTTCKCRYKKIYGCSCIRPEVLKETVKNIAYNMVNLEDNFINLVYQEYSEDQIFMNISKFNLKKYIRFIANKRLNTMGYDNLFPTALENPLPEFEIMINAPINTNFFENRSTDYSKPVNSNNWKTVWGNEKNINNIINEKA